MYTMFIKIRKMLFKVRFLNAVLNDFERCLYCTQHYFCNCFFYLHFLALVMLAVARCSTVYGTFAINFLINRTGTGREREMYLFFWLTWKL